VIKKITSIPADYLRETHLALGVRFVLEELAVLNTVAEQRLVDAGSIRAVKLGIVAIPVR
jgi:hypothetical protein